MSRADGRKPTIHAIKLHEALCRKGVNAILEYPDGYKHVDIAIPDVKLYIEVDGLDHFTEPDRIISDFKRQHYSGIDGFSTFFVTNQIIETHLDEVVHGLFEVVRRLMQKSNLY